MKPGEGQEFLLEAVDFLTSEGEVVQGVVLALDGECNGYDGYCGGCGGCMIMQAAHGGYQLHHHWARVIATHHTAWDDALRRVELWCEEVEREASEAVLYANPEALRGLPAYWDNGEALRAGLRPGAPYRQRGYRQRLVVVW